METRPRIYDSIVSEHLATLRQMIFLSGPRQVGKSTVAGNAADHCLNWDEEEDRRKILADSATIEAALAQVATGENAGRLPVVVFDEIHKYALWKRFVKGFFDTHEKRLKIIVTGSARLNIYKRGGDSMMGRYFPYRVHPWSVAECLHTDIPPEDAFIRPPEKISDEDWDALQRHGGFPEPFLRREPRFTGRWRVTRLEQLAREDLREVSRVQDLGSLETFMHLLGARSAAQLVLANLAAEMNVSVNTIKSWTDLFTRLYHGFLVRPWFANVAKALRKAPKWFLSDWSGIEDAGTRAETFAACHLLKAVEGWTDLGFGSFELRYLRDKMKREVDFLIVRDKRPWCLVEVKSGDAPLSPALAHFQAQTKAKHAFQLNFARPFEAVDCFQYTSPVIAPARTFLSQLL